MERATGRTGFMGTVILEQERNINISSGHQHQLDPIISCASSASEAKSAADI